MDLGRTIYELVTGKKVWNIPVILRGDNQSTLASINSSKAETEDKRLKVPIARIRDWIDRKELTRTEYFSSKNCLADPFTKLGNSTTKKTMMHILKTGEIPENHMVAGNPSAEAKRQGREWGDGIDSG